MFKANSRKWFTRISTFILTMAITLTSFSIPTMQVNAADGDVKGDNGQLASVPNNTKYFPLGFSDIHQGYRFYVIDNNHNLVSKVVDFVYDDTENLRRTVKIQNWYTNTRWQDLSTDGSNYEYRHISALKNDFCGGADPSPYDITDDKTMVPVKISTSELVGAKFQLWFLGKEGRAESIGGSASSSSSGGNSGSSINQNNNNKTQTETVPKLSEDLSYLEDIYENKPDLLNNIYKQLDAGEAVLNNMNTNSAESLLDNIYVVNADVAKNMDTYLNTADSTYKRVYNASKNVGYTNSDASINAIGATYNALIEDGVPSNVAKAIARLTLGGNATNVSYKTSDSILNTNIPLSNATTKTVNTSDILESMGINVDKLSSILDIRIPLAEAEQTEYNFPADRLISKEQSPLNVKGFNVDVSGNGSVTLLDAFRYKENGKFKYALIVEPIFWAGLYENSNKYEPWYTYGTYYNILQYYVQKGWDGSGAHVSYMKAHGKNCMVVSKDIEAFGLLAATDSSRMKLADIKAAIDSGVGYGMHIYHGGDFGGSSSSTSTYDDPLGTTIAPAPDPSSLPPETSDYPTTSKQVTIIKNYVTREESIGTEVVDGNFIRQQNPHIIDIEDEPEYTVVQWETSTHPTPIHHKYIL